MPQKRVELEQMSVLNTNGKTNRGVAEALDLSVHDIERSNCSGLSCSLPIVLSCQFYFTAYSSTTSLVICLHNQ